MEAMASGCYVVGYPGFGGKEIYKKENPYMIFLSGSRGTNLGNDYSDFDLVLLVLVLVLVLV